MITKKEILEIIRGNFKWSPYGSCNWDLIDSFDNTAEEILKKIKEGDKNVE